MCLLRTRRVIAVDPVPGTHASSIARPERSSYVTATHVGPVTRGWQPGEAVGGTARMSARHTPSVGCVYGDSRGSLERRLSQFDRSGTLARHLGTPDVPSWRGGTAGVPCRLLRSSARRVGSPRAPGGASTGERRAASGAGAGRPVERTSMGPTTTRHPPCMTVPPRGRGGGTPDLAKRCRSTSRSWRGR
jgi:hypothetical protein